MPYEQDEYNPYERFMEHAEAGHAVIAIPVALVEGVDSGRALVDRDGERMGWAIAHWTPAPPMWDDEPEARACAAFTALRTTKDYLRRQGFHVK